MKLICDNSICKKEIEIEEKITCPACKAIQKKILMIKPIITGTLLAGIAAFGGYEVSKVTSSSNNSWRYPIETEFTIIDFCINKDPVIQKRDNLERKRERCFKATSETMKQISYNKFRKDKKYFLDVFKQNIQKQQ
ncbi:hypothetical protein RHO13_02200 [Orbus wheelerorum]|uniref:hypothetical protein n=1 Tax=Orbus wheelerorum TaxID=3074111 RepID=UPI00370D27D6